MNLNREMIALGAVLDCPVAQDVFIEKNDTDRTYRFVVFTCEDERPELAGDNIVLMERTRIQLSYYVPLSYNYMTDKEKIKAYLRNLDYYIESLTVFVDDEDVKESTQLRRLLFEIEKVGEVNT
jgi:hypothetical protein